MPRIVRSAILFACIAFAVRAIPAFATPPGFADINAGLPNVQNASAAWGDYDGDGRLDLLLTGLLGSNPISRVYHNNGDGTFTDINAALPGVYHGSVAWGDFDNDGRLDILLTGAGNGVTAVGSIFHNNGNGTFTDINAGLPQVLSSAVAVGDYDHDGDLDLVITGARVSDFVNVTSVYRNDGGGVFTLAASLPGVYYAGVAWGDYDNDGDLDLLVAGEYGINPYTQLFRNDGNDTFTPVNSGIPTLGNAAVAWGDFDRDGFLDVLIAGTNLGYTDQTLLLRNNGNGTFTDTGAGFPGMSFGAVAWGDFDNDGYPDLALNSDVWRNQGNGTFTDFASLAGSGAAAWGDFNGDGMLDLALAGGSAHIYRGQGELADAPPAAPGSPSAHFASNGLVLGWTAPSDDVTPAAGLGYNLRIGSSAGALDIASPMANLATGARSIAQAGPVQGTTWPLAFSSAHADRYWSVQAIDGALAGGPFSAEQHLVVSPSIAGIADIPNDQGGWVRVTFNRAPLDAVGANPPVSLYGVWRHVPGTLAVASGNPAAALASRPDGDASALAAAAPSGLRVTRVNGGILVMSRARGATPDAAGFPAGTWELVASVPALQQAQYVAAVPTVSNAAANSFVVTASTTIPAAWFVSASASGQSADNLAPAPPAPFNGTYSAGAAHLTWGSNTEPDLAGYKLYRGTTASFTPGPSNLVATLTTTSYNDPGASSGNYFKLGAYDVNGNLSAYALTQAGPTTAVGGGPDVAFALDGAANPSHGSALRVTFALPSAAHARLMLMDLGGRRIVDREVGSLGAGHHTLELSQGGRIAPGLYFVRLAQGANAKTVRVTVLD